MKRLRYLGIFPLVMLALGGVAFAQYSSNNYKANEIFFGAGGDTNQSSSNYSARAAAGALGVGQYSSANYQAFSGFITPDEPFLELSIDTTNVDLGDLTTTETNVGTATFHVRAYVDSGYTIQSVSLAPTYTSGLASHTLTSMSLGSPTPGTEGFGINLTGPNNLPNTIPSGDFGAIPSLQPDSSFAFGQVASGYDTANSFQYNQGDVVACSGTSGSCGTTSGWGLTEYTISYVTDISLITPGGNYRVNQDLVVVATY